jgi:hypothetical protein
MNCEAKRGRARDLCACLAWHTDFHGFSETPSALAPPLARYERMKSRDSVTPSSPSLAYLNRAKPVQQTKMPVVGDERSEVKNDMIDMVESGFPRALTETLSRLLSSFPLLLVTIL